MPEEKERKISMVKDVKMQVSVELGRKQITIRDLLSLKMGDTLLLDKDAAEPLVARVEGLPKFLGRAGFYGTNKALQVEGRIVIL